MAYRLDVTFSDGGRINVRASFLGMTDEEGARAIMMARLDPAEEAKLTCFLRSSARGLHGCLREDCGEC